ANRRAEHGKDCRCDLAWVSADRFAQRRFNGWRERTAELTIAARAEGNRFGQLIRQRLWSDRHFLHTIRKRIQLLLLGSDEELAQRRKLGRAHRPLLE